MDYKQVKVPYIGRSSIKEQADLFRKKYWDGLLPIDIEKIISVKLRMDIFPIPELGKLCNTNAFIASDWQTIYVDKEMFDDEENRYMNRLRFSFAHEIGHFILHKDTYNSLGIKDFFDFYKFLDGIPGNQYGYFETQANYFANYLLVPRDKLTSLKEVELKKIGDMGVSDENLLNSYIAIPLANVFGVSNEAIEIAIKDLNND